MDTEVDPKQGYRSNISIPKLSNKLRILLMADNKPGLFVSSFLFEQNEHVIGLCLHEDKYQNNGDEIIRSLDIKKENIFEIKDIKDDEKAYICAIPAYNTGIGNVSKTLSGTTKLKPAAEAANKMTSQELYNKLLTKLKYKEARDYLERVWERKDKYKG